MNQSDRTFTDPTGPSFWKSSFWGFRIDWSDGPFYLIEEVFKDGIDTPRKAIKSARGKRYPRSGPVRSSVESGVGEINIELDVKGDNEHSVSVQHRERHRGVYLQIPADGGKNAPLLPQNEGERLVAGRPVVKREMPPDVRTENLFDIHRYTDEFTRHDLMMYL